MEIPFYILLILYLVGIAVFLLLTFFSMYHLFKFGLFDFTGKLHAFLFAGFTVVVIALTVLLLFETPWFDSFNLFSLPSDIITIPGGGGVDSTI
ncbi:hypothetical protein ACFL2M_00315 [Patescibacteria group bacterium]